MSDLLDRELIQLLSEFTSWTGYAGYLVAESVVSERQANRQLQRIADRYTILRKAKTVAETKALVQQEPEYLEAEDKLSAIQDYSELIKSMYTHLESCGKTVSRELTRRTSRNNLEDRSDKYGS